MKNKKFLTKNNKTGYIVKPEVIYSNLWTNKVEILKTNKGKSGVYRFNNLITGNSYIGASINISRRLRCYLSVGFIENKVNKSTSNIYSSLLKHNYVNFSLDILEYCDRNVLIEREQHYMDLLSPEYNILKRAGNRLGSKHSEASKAKMKLSAITSVLSPWRKINHLLAVGHITVIINKKNNSEKLYSSITAAAIDLGANRNTVSKYTS